MHPSIAARESCLCLESCRAPPNLVAGDLRIKSRSRPVRQLPLIGKSAGQVGRTAWWRQCAAVGSEGERIQEVQLEERARANLVS